MKLVDSIGYTMTLQEIAALVVDHNAECYCKYKFTKSDIRSYDHYAGISVLGYPFKQWVYLTCQDCHYQMAIWKILNKLGIEKEVLHQ